MLGLCPASSVTTLAGFHAGRTLDQGQTENASLPPGDAAFPSDVSAHLVQISHPGLVPEQIRN